MDSLYKILNNTTRHRVTRKGRKRREESRKARYKEPIKKNPWRPRDHLQISFLILSELKRTELFMFPLKLSENQ